MPTPRLSFTQLSNSYKVKVENLEELSVAQIQELQSFVSNRKGIFDFHTYSFSIQKRVGFSEFVTLLQKLNINARCTELLVLKKEEARVAFGQYKGLFFSELPTAYLEWLRSNYSGKDKEKIEAECKKRGI